MAHPALGFLFLVGAGIAVAVGFLWATGQQGNNSYNNNYESRPPDTNYDSWTIQNSGPSKPRRRKRSLTNSQCSICLSGNCNVITTPCEHAFHSDCLREWIEKSVERSCPNCRKSISNDFI